LDEGTIDLVERWRAGDQQAATELFRRYASQLIGLARSRLSAKLAPRVDPEDVVQSAYRSFFVGVRAGEYELGGEGDLWHLLVAITLNKLQQQRVRHQAKKRDVRAERGFGSEDSLLGIQLQVLARVPSPLEALTLVDQVEQVMRSLTPVERQVLELRLQGHHLGEIATQTRRSLRSVCRAIEQIKQRLEEERAGDDAR
jgi:RNA polymerase sigma factor (sigma-70 family)